MSEVVMQCVSLSSLNLNGCPGIGDGTLRGLAMRCYAVQAPKSAKTNFDDLMNDRVQRQYNAESIGSQEVWSEAELNLPLNDKTVSFEVSGVTQSKSTVVQPTRSAQPQIEAQPQDEDEDEGGIKMSKAYGGVIKEYVEESLFEPLQLQELPMSDRCDVTIFINVHNVFLMEKLFNDVSTLTVTDLYVAATHNNSMARTEPGRASDQMKFKRTLELGDIDEVSKRINLTLSAKTSIGAALVYGEVSIPLPKFIDVPGERFRAKMLLSDDFNSKLLKSLKKKPIREDESQEESYKKAKLTGNTQSHLEKTISPTIAVIEITVELASPVSAFALLFASFNCSFTDSNAASK
jgi:hypothetical protein